MSDPFEDGPPVLTHESFVVPSPPRDWDEEDPHEDYMLPTTNQQPQQNHNLGHQGGGGGATPSPAPHRSNIQTPAPEAGADGAPLMYLWATGIAIETFKADFESFLQTYRVEGSTRPLPHFHQMMQKMHANNKHVLPVDFSILRRERPQLYSHSIAHPSECLQLMSAVAEHMYQSMFPDDPKDYTITVGAHELPYTVSLRTLEPQHIETLVAVKGMVVRTSRLLPEVRVAHFRCWNCHKSHDEPVHRGRIFEPTRCNHCGKQCSYQLIHNISLYEDKQIIRVQEAPENLAEGETPVTLSIVVYGDLVDSVVPGDRVVVTGIYRSAPLKLNPNTRIIRNVFRTHVDAVHIAKTAKGSAKVFGGEEQPFTADEEVKMHELARLPDIEAILVRSLAPGIWGHDDVKRGVLCQLFGGCKKKFRHGKFRAELNVLLCGDPGVAKSQLLTRVHQLTPRGVYTSGKGSSSVGLTAFVVRDADTQEFVLEPGALVLSDRGLCCIDEFDKMNEATRSVLHEVMEQQTLSIAKAGIIAQLNARTSVLAAANPKESQWNQSLNVVENLQIEPTLLSRFDLIFLLLDREDSHQDRMLATHVLSLYMPVTKKKRTGDDNDEGEEAAAASGLPDHPWFDSSLDPRTLGPKHLARYIAYAKERCNPNVTEAAGKALTQSYLALRSMSQSGKTVSATLRQLESLIRLAEARAKMRLAHSVLEEDVIESRSLIETALRMSAMDPRTGQISMEMFAAGDPTRFSAESCMRALEEVIKQNYTSAGKRNAPLPELRRALVESVGRPIAPHQFIEVLSLVSGGDVVKAFTSATVTFDA